MSEPLSMTQIPRESCPIEAQYSGPERTRLVLALTDREPGVTAIHCFTPPTNTLEDDALRELKEQSASCETCQPEANCPLGELIMKAELTE